MGTKLLRIRLLTLQLTFVIILCCIKLALSGNDYDHVIIIDPAVGEDIEPCTNGTGLTPCETLGWAFKSDFRQNSTQYILKDGQHTLSSSTETFEKLSSLAFVGNSSNVVIHCTEENSGLAFQEVLDLRFVSLTFFNCSALRHSTSRKYQSSNDSTCNKMYQTRVALYFHICSDVEMINVNVSHSPNAIGVLMYNVNGANFIQNSTFEYNQLSEMETEIPGGGGFYIEFTYCVPSGESCSCSYPNYSKMPAMITEHNHNSSYTFENCTFSKNIASSIDETESNSNYIIPNKQSHVAFGRGGGLSIFVKGVAYGNSFSVSKCTFRDNHAIWGGGLLISFMDAALNNTLLVTDTEFQNNSCRPNHRRKHHGTGGGGMRIGHSIFNARNSPRMKGNRVFIRHCNYTRNMALTGGGLSISPTLQFYRHSFQLIIVKISNSRFIGNMAKIGSALEVTLFPIVVSGGPPAIHVVDCKFIMNKVHYAANQTMTETGIGAVYGNGVMLNFFRTVHFEQNNGTALAVVDKRVSFRNCAAVFTDNTGRAGGAINLLGISYILVNDNTSMSFIRNRAEVHGGAISNSYIGRDYIITNPNCFVRHLDSFRNPDEWRTKFYFEDNHGSLHGNDSIHTTSTSPCAWPGWKGSKNIIMCRHNWVYCRNDEMKSCSSEIWTSTGSMQFTTASNNNLNEFDPPGYVYRDNLDTVSETFTHRQSRAPLPRMRNNRVQLPLKAIPGKAFKLPLELKDDFYHNTNSTTVFAVRTLHTDVSQIDPHFVYTTGGYLRLNGISNNTVEVHLDTLGERAWHVKLQVDLLACPPGFVLSDNPPRYDSKCICNPNNYQKRLRCDQAEFSASLRNGYWMGTTPESDGSLVVSLCLPGFCIKNNSADYLVLPSTVQEIDKQMCSNRTGILCGYCITGYGPAINRRNYECIPCNSTNNAVHTVYYVLAVYAPLLVMFTGIILFNIRFTTGPANAFIFYSQIISSTFDLTGDNHIPLNLLHQRMPILLGVYRIPYGIFNLDFLENFIRPLCLGTGLNALDALQMDYIVATFPLIMILLVLLALKIKSSCSSFRYNILLRRHGRQQLHDYISEVESPTIQVPRSRVPRCMQVVCKWIQNWQAGESLLHAFSAFLLLSYTKFALTSSYIVNLHPILGANGSQIGPRRAYYAGHFTEHDVMYIWRYYVPSCFIIVIIGVIPIMLLWYPIIWLEKCIHRVEWIWHFYPVTKIHVFMDTFQGCYRDDRRFFAAMYFVFRLTINVGYILTDTWLQQFIVQQIACTVFIVVFVLCWPYRDEKWIFNYVDFLMLANLAIVNALSLYLFAFSQNNHGLALPRSAFWVQYFLVLLPLIYMIVFVVWYLLTPSQKKKIIRFFSKYANIEVIQKRNLRRHRIVHQSSTPYYSNNYTAANSTSNSQTGDQQSGSIDAQNHHTVQPTIVTASDLDFIEEDDNFSCSDEEEAMLARACDRNRYKPPKPVTTDDSKQPQQKYIKRDFKMHEASVRSEENDVDSSPGGVDQQNQILRNGADLRQNCEEEGQQQQRELATMDSGFASGRTGTGGGKDSTTTIQTHCHCLRLVLSEGTGTGAAAGSRDLYGNDRDERQEICCSAPHSQDYGTM